MQSLNLCHMSVLCDFYLSKILSYSLVGCGELALLKSVYLAYCAYVAPGSGALPPVPVVAVGLAG